MVVHSDASLTPVKGRMKYSSHSRKRRSSKARSSISGGLWDQSSSPPLHQALFPNSPRTPPVVQDRHGQKVRFKRPPMQAGCPQWILAIDQGTQQRRPFDTFVDVPSPFAKPKPKSCAKSHECHSPDKHNVSNILTDSSSNPTSPHYHSSPHSKHQSFPNQLHLTSGATMDPDRTWQSIPGYLDQSTRTANLQHTRAEWTTWDFVDLFITHLPPGIRTVDLWKNFKKEGEVDVIDIFVTRGGQKDTKSRLRFR